MAKYEPSPHEEINKICQELSFFGIDLLPPDLAKSDMDFKIEGDDIRFGLNSIKGVSEKSLQSLKDFRDSENPNKYDIFFILDQTLKFDYQLQFFLNQLSQMSNFYGDNRN